MLCAPVFIFTSGSSALLGRPRCGLSMWLSLLAIFNTLFWVYANFFHEKMDKIRKSAIFAWYENGRRRLLGAQSINAERAPLFLFTGSSTATDVKLMKRLKSSSSYLFANFIGGLLRYNPSEFLQWPTCKQTNKWIKKQTNKQASKKVFENGDCIRIDIFLMRNRFELSSRLPYTPEWKYL